MSKRDFVIKTDGTNIYILNCIIALSSTISLIIMKAIPQN